MTMVRRTMGAGVAALAAGGLAAGVALGVISAAPEGGPVAASQPPTGLGSAPDGSLWVALGGSSSVDGTLARLATPLAASLAGQALIEEPALASGSTAGVTGKRPRPVDVAVGADGRVFTAAAGASSLAILRPDQTGAGRVVQDRLNPGIPVRPTGVTVDGAGNAWVSTIEGTVVQRITPPGGGIGGRRDYDSGGFGGPTSASISRDVVYNPVDGYVYAAVDGQAFPAREEGGQLFGAGKAPDRIVRFDPSINPQDPAVNPNADIHYPIPGSAVDADSPQNPTAIAVGPDGDLWVTLSGGTVANGQRNEVLRFRPSLGTPVRNNGDLNSAPKTGWTTFTAPVGGEAPAIGATSFTNPTLPYGSAALAGGDFYYTQASTLGRIPAGATAAEDVTLNPGFGALAGIAFANARTGFVSGSAVVGRLALPVPPAPPPAPPASSPAGASKAIGSGAAGAAVKPLRLTLGAPKTGTAGKRLRLTLRLRGNAAPARVLLQRKSGKRFVNLTARTVRGTSATLGVSFRPGVYRLRIAVRQGGVLRVSPVVKVTVTG